MKLVLFDFDGVLADSLGAHLEFFEKMNRQYNLKLAIPSPQEKEKIRYTTYDNFLASLGFPHEFITPILDEYDRVFRQEYPVTLFSGAQEMIEETFSSYDHHGIISMNSKKNLEAVLGNHLSRFSFVMASDNKGKKSDAMKQCLERFALLPDEGVYVGDTLTDLEETAKAGLHFIGTTYGWELERHHEQYVTSFGMRNRLVHDVAELRRTLKVLRKNQKKGFTPFQGS